MFVSTDRRSSRYREPRRYTVNGLGSSFSDILKVGSSVLPAGGGDVIGGSGATVATAALDFLYAREQARIQALLDHSDQVIQKTGKAVDWGRWALVGVAAAGAYYLFRRSSHQSLSLSR